MLVLIYPRTAIIRIEISFCIYFCIPTSLFFGHPNHYLCIFSIPKFLQRSLSIVSLPGLSVIYSMAVSTAVTLCQGHVTEVSLWHLRHMHSPES